jgi:hypothetical protein
MTTIKIAASLSLFTIFVIKDFQYLQPKRKFFEYFGIIKISIFLYFLLDK